MRPPEAFGKEDGHAAVDGRSFDIWCMGWLTLDLLTQGYLENKIPENCTWETDIYPTLYKVIKKKEFNKLCRSTFPNCYLKNKTLKAMRNLSATCMRFSFQERPSANSLLHHAFLDSDGELHKKDSIWKTKVKKKSWKSKLDRITSGIFIVGLKHNLMTQLDSNLSTHSSLPIIEMAMVDESLLLREAKWNSQPNLAWRKNRALPSDSTLIKNLIDRDSSNRVKNRLHRSVDSVYKCIPGRKNNVDQPLPSETKASLPYYSCCDSVHTAGNALRVKNCSPLLEESEVDEDISRDITDDPTNEKLPTRDGLFTRFAQRTVPNSFFSAAMRIDAINGLPRPIMGGETDESEKTQSEISSDGQELPNKRISRTNTWGFWIAAGLFKPFI